MEFEASFLCPDALPDANQLWIREETLESKNLFSTS